MAFSKQELREMRENSAAGAAKQRLREKAQLDRYMMEREINMAGMMTTKERNAIIVRAHESGKSVEEIAEQFGITETRVSQILKQHKSPGGVIDAAELTQDEQDALAAEIMSSINGEAGPAEQPEVNSAAVFDAAREIMTALRAAQLFPEGIHAELMVCEGLCSLFVKADSGNDTATLTWEV